MLPSSADCVEAVCPRAKINTRSKVRVYSAFKNDPCHTFRPKVHTIGVFFMPFPTYIIQNNYS